MMQLYECLLTMEESDIRMSILCNADEKDLLRRSLNAKRVTTALTNNEKLLSILYVPKGKVKSSSSSSHSMLNPSPHFLFGLSKIVYFLW